MEPLIINGTEDTPEIVFNCVDNIFQISGKSLPDDALSFYKPVRDWIDEYIKVPNDETVVSCKMVRWLDTQSRLPKTRARVCLIAC